jgi:hypothetical protein
MAEKPSFLRDPDQAAELAALLEDTADEREATGDGGIPMSRTEHTRHVQTIARYRRWAAELVTEPEAEPAAPVHIRPATRHTERHAEGATG